MSKGLIATFPDKPRYLAGERLEVTSAIANDGDAVLPVADPGGASPYSYRLLRPEDGAEIAQLSASRAALLLDPDPTPPIEPTYSHALSPGQSIGINEEIGHMLPLGIPPGRHHLVASYRGPDAPPLVSAPSRVEVFVPQLAALRSARCSVRGTLGTVLAARDELGEMWLLQRESAAQAPMLGVFHRRRSLGNPAHVQDLCTTIDAAEVRSGRWMAWLDRGSLAALLGFGDRIQRSAAPVALGLTRPRLVHPGVQMADATAVLFAWGMTAADVVVKAYRASAKGLELVGHALLGGRPTGPVRAAIEPTSQTLHLVWDERHEASITLRTRTFDIALGARERAPRTLAAVEGSLPAWALASIAGASGPDVQILVGSEGRLVHHRASELAVAPMPAADVQAWALAAAPSGSNVPGSVVAHAGERIWWWSPGDRSGWRVAVEGVPAVRALGAFHAGLPGYFVEWFDPGWGYRMAPLRELSAMEPPPPRGGTG